MSPFDLLRVPGVEQVQLLPPHLLSPQALAHGCQGVVWVSQCGLMNRLHQEGLRVVPNTQLKQLQDGDYGAVFLDDDHYLVVCDQAGQR